MNLQSEVLMFWRFPDRPGGLAGLPLTPTRVMGVLNVTPDSFSDGGRYAGVAQAVSAGVAMWRAGAAVIDVGGESTRPGAERISAAEQIGRVVPVIERLRELLDKQETGLTEPGSQAERDAPSTGPPAKPGAKAVTHPVMTPGVISGPGALPGAGVISVDTTSAEVARAALGAGASIVNDVSAGREDPSMFALAAERGCPLVLMHMAGQPADMQDDPRYADVVAEVEAFLLERVEIAERVGVARGQIAIDPGIGFGKTLAHNLALLRATSRLAGHGLPVVVGVSRKRMIPAVTGRGEPAGDRLGGSIAGALVAAQQGAGLVRVHDVAATVQALAVDAAVRNPPAGPSTR
ncbi:MAG: dihydropteroate synthase [Planctomycetota bacterium]